MTTSTFLDDYEKAKKALAEEPVTEETQKIDFPECRGMSFKEFWEWLPLKLEFMEDEEELFQALENKKKIRIKKPTGYGITTFMARYVAWKCLKDDEWKNMQLDVSVVLITGASQELSNKIIGRMKGLFTNKEFKTKESVIILNDCRIEAFPTNHLEPARGLNPRLVWIDEADFFPTRYQDEARTVGERYRAKGDASVVMISTTNLPGGLYERMDEEGDQKNGYLTMEFDYTKGIGIVYDADIIEEEKRTNPSFPREYMLQYGYGLGDIFSNIDDVIEEYNTERIGGRACTTADPAFGFSSFGVCAGETRDSIIYVTAASEYVRSSPSDMLDVMENLAVTHDNNCLVDAAHPGFIRDLIKRGVNAKPVNFGHMIYNTEGKDKQSLRSKMTINASMMVKNRLVRIHPSFKKLISYMRAATFDKTGGIDKSEVSFDVLDAFIMMCWELAKPEVTMRKIKGKF